MFNVYTACLPVTLLACLLSILYAFLVSVAQSLRQQCSYLPDRWQTTGLLTGDPLRLFQHSINSIGTAQCGTQVECNDSRMQKRSAVSQWTSQGTQHMGVSKHRSHSVYLAVVLLVTGIVSSCAQIGSHGDTAAALLASCYTSSLDQLPPQGATFRRFYDGQHAWLRMHSVMWSRKQPCQDPTVDTPNFDNSAAPDTCPLTVVTTLTLSRLSALEQLCSSWPGPLSAALYVPLEQPGEAAGLTPANAEKLASTTAAARALFERLEAAGPRACALRLTVVYETLGEPIMHLLLPINSLRNVALLAASSPLIAMIDVDLIISSSLGQQLITAPADERRHRSHELVSTLKDRAIMILPALEPHTRRREGVQQLLAWADTSIQGDKAHLRDMVEAKQMCYFQEMSYPKGHRLTDFPRWYHAKWPYHVKWQLFFEPWFIVSRAANPWYDVRFQGYGYNKQNHVAHLAAAGYQFMVHPDAFIVHRPHNKTRVQRLYVVALNARARIAKAGQELNLPTNFTDASQLSASDVGALLQFRVNSVFKENQRDMQGDHYTPIIDWPTQNCIRLLPWWHTIYHGSCIHGLCSGPAT